MKITYENWCKSIIDLDLDGIIFHNNYSETFCETFSNKNIQFIKIEHDPKFNPNVFRYLIYNEFLKTNSERIKNVFVTDISDVVVINNPFEESFFNANPDFI